jgi:hypothetical protein
LACYYHALISLEVKSQAVTYYCLRGKA